MKKRKILMFCRKEFKILEVKLTSCMKRVFDQPYLLFQRPGT